MSSKGYIQSDVDQGMLSDQSMRSVHACVCAVPALTFKCPLSTVLPLQSGTGQRSQNTSIQQKSQMNKSAYNSYNWGAN